MELNPRRLVNRLGHLTLLAPLAVLAAFSAYALFMTSDPKVQAVFERCLAGDNEDSVWYVKPATVAATPICCLASFFEAALGSTRSKIIMAEILSYAGALLMVMTLESARPRNQRNRIIANPTTPWLVFNLAGGALIWQLVIIPAFLHHEKKNTQLLRPQNQSDGHDIDAPSEGVKSLTNDSPANRDKDTNIQNYSEVAVSVNEIRAISLAVSIGYYFPSTLMLYRPCYSTIVVWHFFPIYIMVLRRTLRVWSSTSLTTTATEREHQRPITSPKLLLYSIPMGCSFVAHVALLHHMAFIHDDNSTTTRATLRLIQLDIALIGLTIMYWMTMVRGIRSVFINLIVGCVIGPGAALCLTWILHDTS